MIEVNQWYLEEAVAPWIYLSHANSPPDGYDFDPEDNDHIASLVRKDLVPWIQQWPPLLLKRLRDALEYSLLYDGGALSASHDLQTYSWLYIEDAREAVWEPMFAELFGELTVRPEDSYRLLRGNDQPRALNADCGEYRFLDHMPEWLPGDL